MTTTGTSKPTKTVIAVILLLVLTAASTALYYNSLLSSKTSSDTATINSLQNSLQALQGANNALNSQISALKSTTNSTTTSGDPVQIYSSASPSVVTVQGTVTTTAYTFFGPQTSTSTVLGSGFVTTYGNSTYIVTNYHVVDGATGITVTFGNGDSFAATVIGTDPYSDLAVVTADAPASEYVPITVVTSSDVVVGQPVYVIGNPYGLSGSMTYGIVSQLGRTIQENTTGGFSISGVIQFSAPINPGNSGGPLLDGNGEVIGITTAVVSGSQGVGFAIPSGTILRELPSLVTIGTYKLHSYIGINSADMTYQLAKASNSNATYGVLIEQVTSGSPAATAGLRGGTRTTDIGGETYRLGGDQIVSINGTRIMNGDALSTYLEEYTVAGQNVQLGIIRGGVLMTVDVTLGARPALSG